jgi:predicted transposase YbfD/YdcC
MEVFGKDRINWLRKFLKLEHGIPSHDTFGDVFSALDPESVTQAFVEWVETIRQKVSGEVVSIDGKTIRASKDAPKNKKAVHIVSAWASQNKLVLGQLATEVKSNEITAIPKLLELLDIKGCIITIDAMGTQTAIAEKIIEKEGDYILAVKGNQGSLEEEVHTTCKRNRPVYDTSTVEKGHGRIETRRCEVFEKGWIVDPEDRWKKLTSVIKITSTRELTNKTETQVRFYISSLNTDNDFNKHIRNHWAVENNLHWTLDMIFREDEQRKRAKHAAANFAIVRKIALNLLKKDKGKESLRSKRLKAAWNKDYLVNLLKI